MRHAAADGERIEIDYWSAGRDELTTRRIDPGPPFFALGEWYTDACCHRAGDNRMFRIDRIRAVRPTGETFEPAATTPRAPAPSITASRRPAGDPRAPAGRGVGRRDYPAESVEDRPTVGSGSCSR